MNDALAVLLADWVHHWDRETPDSERKLDIQEARQHLQGFARLLLDDELKERLATRLARHRGVEKPEPIDFASAQDFMDALKDEIMEDRAPEDADKTVEMLEIERLTDPQEKWGKVKCSWCGRELSLSSDYELAPRWAAVGVEGKTAIECEMSPTDFHEPEP